MSQKTVKDNAGAQWIKGFRRFVLGQIGDKGLPNIDLLRSIYIELGVRPDKAVELLDDIVFIGDITYNGGYWEKVKSDKQLIDEYGTTDPNEIAKIERDRKWKHGQ